MKEIKVYINKMPESCWDCFYDYVTVSAKDLKQFLDEIQKLEGEDESL